jgi:hypothetical protein
MSSALWESMEAREMQRAETARKAQAQDPLTRAIKSHYFKEYSETKIQDAVARKARLSKLERWTNNCAATMAVGAAGLLFGVALLPLSGSVALVTTVASLAIGASSAMLAGGFAGTFFGIVRDAQTQAAINRDTYALLDADLTTGTLQKRYAAEVLAPQIEKTADTKLLAEIAGKFSALAVKDQPVTGGKSPTAAVDPFTPDC